MRLLPLFLLAAGAALAEAQPPVLPLRDVTVVYRLGGAAADAIPGGAPAGTVRVRWSAADQRLRVDADGRTQALIVDLRAPRAEALDTALRTAMSLPVLSRDLEPLTLRNARLTRRGQATAAGRACTEYAAEDRRGRGTICLTDDGVALRARGEVDGKEGSATAVSVSYGKLSPDLFEVPKGYVQLTLPKIGRRP